MDGDEKWEEGMGGGEREAGKWRSLASQEGRATLARHIQSSPFCLTRAWACGPHSFESEKLHFIDLHDTGTSRDAHGIRILPPTVCFRQDPSAPDAHPSLCAGSGSSACETEEASRPRTCLARRRTPFFTAFSSSGVTSAHSRASLLAVPALLALDGVPRTTACDSRPLFCPPPLRFLRPILIIIHHYFRSLVVHRSTYVHCTCIFSCSSSRCGYKVACRSCMQ
ncbi:hypothetical protein C8R47DRAFT_1086822 [Mycena vitilis]|nr:hypothetical protein C8R47DRAFT_1086822 [Mycena vitilis]